MNKTTEPTTPLAVRLDRRVMPQALSRCQQVMEPAGWEIEYVDIDLTRVIATAEIKLTRFDGRWLWARTDKYGRCTIEIFHRECALGMAHNQSGRRPLVPLVEDVFLARRKQEGARSMLRSMTNYLTDNAMHAVALEDVRRAWAGVMNAPVQFLGHNGGGQEPPAFGRSPAP